MSFRSDILAQVTDKYGGAIGWNSFTEPYTSAVRPAFEVSLFIKDSTIPARRTKVTEIYTVPSLDHRSEMDTTTALLFTGAPEMLQVTISGFILTPVVNRVWQTPYGAYTYGEVVSMYLNGELNRTIGAAPQRVDPDYYVAPNGEKYTKPIIANWDTAQTLNMKKQTFSATIYLER